MTPASLSQDEQVAFATQDLANRLEISPDMIELVEIAQVIWRDGSLGCPQPGMLYTQALVNGVRIRLCAGDLIFHYHSSRNGIPFLCENPSEEGGDFPVAPSYR